MDISNLKATGLPKAEILLDKAAVQVSRASDQQDAVNLSSGAVALIQAKNDFSANVNVLKVADQMEKTTIDLVG